MAVDLPSYQDTGGLDSFAAVSFPAASATGAADHREKHAAPAHLAVIMDGNRRWARRHTVGNAEAYEQGAAKVGELLGWCSRAGIGIVSVFALSLANLRRSQDDVEVLVQVIIDGLWRLADEQHWHLRPIGRLDMLPGRTAIQLREIEQMTSGWDSGIANIAVVYDGRAEIACAARRAVAELAAAGLDSPQIRKELTEARIRDHLYTSGQPDPDLLIRTSGEQRLSGFMSWQTADCELYFANADWPEFTRTDFDDALRSYTSRQRRFGL